MRSIRVIAANDAEACRALLAALGDTPPTALAQHLLSRGWGRAIVVGDPHEPGAAVIESTLAPEMWPAGEPPGYGADHAALWAALRQMGGWGCVLVERPAAEPHGARRVRAAGLTPVWGAGHDNDASLHIARLLGCAEVTRRTFVIRGAAPEDSARPSTT
ncbi:MAG TPA: hypothetical protein VFN74_01600 [Chloroflexota bacterium]|nr:hypothetical protein [Chloroflexota bacterium]